MGDNLESSQATYLPIESNKDLKAHVTLMFVSKKIVNNAVTI